MDELQTQLRRAEMWPERADGSSAALERPLLEPLRVIPRSIRLEDGALVWEPDAVEEVREELSPTVSWVYYKRRERPQVARSDEGVLSDFLGIATPEPSDLPGVVLKYARKHGPLLICDLHGFPNCPIREDERCGLGRERLDHWQVWARYFRALLEIGAELHRERGKGPVEAWTVVVNAYSDLMGTNAGPSALFENNPVLDPVEMFSDGRLTEAHVEKWRREYDDEEIRQEFGGRVNDLLRFARIAPRFSWNDRARIELDGYDLLGALTRQLLFAMARVDGLAVCSGCGCLIVPQRRPRADQRSWCRSEKCRRAADRQHKRDSRRREQAKTD